LIVRWLDKVNKMSNNKELKFCKCFQLEKGINFLFAVDLIGCALYIADIIAIIYGFDGSDLYF
jgi:hypothetical protein